MAEPIAYACLAIIVIVMFVWWATRVRETDLDGRIVAFLRDVPNSSGARLSTILGVGSARLYPALARLERDGVIMGEFEPFLDSPHPWNEGQQTPHIPRRRLYRLKEKHDRTDQAIDR